MNKKIIYIVVGIALILGAITLSRAVIIKNPNDYYAFVEGFTDLNTDPVNESQLDVSYQVRYIPVTASATYTFTLGYETTSIDMNQPSTIQSKMRRDITDDAMVRGFNLLKIVLPDYNIMPPLTP